MDSTEHPEPSRPKVADDKAAPEGSRFRRYFRASPLRRLQNKRWARVMVFSTIAAVGGALIISDALLPDCEHEGCPAVERLNSYRPPEPPKIMDARGELAGQLQGPRRTVVSRDSIPEVIREGYIAVEDRRFREHGGVDFAGGARAFIRNLGSGQVDEGASTITMQLARNVFGEEVMDYNRWHRKATELRTAREIEDQLTKDEILELYLNQIYLGDGVYGVETASRHYFGKSVRDVDLSQAAILIGLAKNPEGYNPRRNPDRAQQRRDLVLDLLVKDGVINAGQAAAAKERPIEVIEDDQGPTDWGTNAYYFNAVWRELRELVPASADRAGMRLFTGLDPEAQNAAALALVAEIRAIESGKLGRFKGKAAPAELPRAPGDSPYLQGMAVAMDAQTGLVSTLVGGRDYDHSEFDRAFQAKRQPGSSFKPIVYLTALASGLRPSEVIPTEPIRLAQRGSEDWEPGDHVSASQLSVRDALVYSSNTASVRVGQRAGIERVIDQAQAMGISTDLPHYPSLFLGAGDVVPVELVAAYATFGNGGHTVKPHLITRIEDAGGRVLYERPQEAGVAAVDPRLGFLVLDMMRDVVRRGTGTRAALPGIPVAGKTGTTNDSKDLWFIGLTPKRVAGVWIGFDNPRTVIANMGGGDAAAPVWARFMAVAVRGDKGVGDWTAPAGIVQATIDSQTGYRWSPGCTGQARTEYFLSGTEPAGECVSYGSGWVMNTMGEWEYQGTAYDSLSYGSPYPSYGARTYTDSTTRTMFYNGGTGDAAEFERRRRAQLDSLDRVWAARRGQPAQPAITDSKPEEPVDTDEPPTRDLPAEPIPATSAPMPTAPDPTAIPTTPGPEIKPAVPDTAGIR